MHKVLHSAWFCSFCPGVSGDPSSSSALIRSPIRSTRRSNLRRTSTLSTPPKPAANQSEGSYTDLIRLDQKELKSPQISDPVTSPRKRKASAEVKEEGEHKKAISPCPQTPPSGELREQLGVILIFKVFLILVLIILLCVSLLKPKLSVRSECVLWSLCRKDWSSVTNQERNGSSVSCWVRRTRSWCTRVRLILINMCFKERGGAEELYFAGGRSLLQYHIFYK